MEKPLPHAWISTMEKAIEAMEQSLDDAKLQYLTKWTRRPQSVRDLEERISNMKNMRDHKRYDELLSSRP